MLFFLPNIKYENYLNAIINQLDNKYYIISRSRLVNNYPEIFTINDNILSGQFFLLFKALIFFTTYPIYLLIKKDTKEMAILLANHALFFKLILDLQVFNKIFNNE